VRRAAWAVGLVALGAGAAVASSTAMLRVAGRATMHHSLCTGGIRVTPEMVEQLPPPEPVGAREFLVVAGDQITTARPAARFATRADGTFVTRLPPGHWCIFDAGRKLEPDAPTLTVGVDAGCMESYRRRCDLALAVKKDVKDAQIVLTQPCPQP
jgi:hypothetical protein